MSHHPPSPTTSRRALLTGASALTGGLLLNAPSAHAAPPRTTAPRVLNVGFENWPVGDRYDRAHVDADWGPEVEYLIDTADARIVAADRPGAGNRKQLRVGFAADKYQAQSMFQFESRLAPLRRYRMSYRLYFEPGFQFSRGNDIKAYGGGKLPGLGGGTVPSGGSDDPAGMSARLMWRGDNGSGGIGGTPWRSYIELYLYWQAKVDPFGDRFLLTDVVDDRWYHIDLDVDCGTVDTDGRIVIKVDGVVRHDRPYRFIAPGQDWLMNTAFLSTFYGGNEPLWAPTADTALRWDEFRIRPGC
ncbi:MAG: polysaccharide lyase [Dermatophilaceae bacterium]